MTLESSTIDNVLEVRKDLLQTDTFNDTLKNVQNKSKLILHCYGVAGCGKSQLVQSLAQTFPYFDTKELPVKWYIQCTDTGNELKKDFLKLAESLRKNGYIPKGNDLTPLKEDLEKDQPKRLVEMLLSCKRSVLIIIEDPAEKESKLLQDFFKIWNKNFLDTKQNKFHIYVTSRSRTVIPPKSTTSIECYKLQKILGFTEEESIRFLKEAKNATRDTSDKDLVLIHKHFSGLPLGLLWAKCCCEYIGLNYKKYLKLANKPSNNIQSKEEEAIRKLYGPSAAAVHIFQAIVMTFFPKDQTFVETENTDLFWRILCCISYFHFDGIPRFLIDYCCHIVWDTSKPKIAEEKEAETGLLIRRLLDYGMCTEIEDGDITFHEVVLTAFRVKHQAAQDFNPLKQAIETMCGLVTLDLRINLNRMRKLRPHLESLLKHIEENIKVLKKDKEFEKVAQAVMSHLYQTLGAILMDDELSLKEEITSAFRKSFEQIWSDMANAISCSSFDIDETANSIGNTKTAANSVADEIIKKSAEKSNSLPANFILKYSSWTLPSHFEKHELDFLRSECKEKFGEIQALLESQGCKEEFVQKLQELQLFLPDKVFRPIFYAERFASIMHSWSRHYLYCTNDQAKKECNWKISLCIAVSEKIRKSSSPDSAVPLLVEWLSKLNGLIPYLLQQKEQPRSLKVAKKLCQNLIKHEDLKLYENGLVKTPFSTLTWISILRYMVRINTKSVNYKTKHNPTFLLPSDKQCKKLCDLVIENANTVNRLNYLSNCGNYHAAKKDFDKALSCYQKFFELSCKPNLKPRFDKKCWVVNQYSKIVASYDSTIKVKQDAIKQCQDVLDSKEFIKHDLKNQLEKILVKLNSQIQNDQNCCNVINNVPNNKQTKPNDLQRQFRKLYCTRLFIFSVTFIFCMFIVFIFY